MDDNQLDSPDSELVEALQDERARRAFAEQTLSQEKERTRIWRDRAEERKALLDRANRRRSKFRRRDTRAKQSSPAPALVRRAPATTVDVASERKPSHPTIRVATAGLDLPKGLLPSFDTVGLAGSSDAVLAGSDFVLASGTETDPALTNRLTQWCALPGRQPLVVFAGRPVGDRPSPLEALADLVLVDDAEQAEIHRRRGLERVEVLQPAIHVEDAVPVRFAPRTGPIEWSGTGPVVVGQRGGVPTAVLIEEPSVEAMEWAGRGVPVFCIGGSVSQFGDRNYPDREVAMAAANTLCQSPIAWERESVSIRRHVLRDHTWDQRGSWLLDALGVRYPGIGRDIAAMLVTNRPDLFEDALEGMRSQGLGTFELVLGLHGNGFPTDNEIIDLAKGMDITVIRFPERTPLGVCLNDAAGATSARYLAKVDDDDFYGPNYLEDAVLSFAYSSADVVGKASHFTYLQSEDVTIVSTSGNESVLSPYVIGSSLVVDRAIWEHVRFPERRQRVDSIFLRGCNAVGAKVFSDHRFEFAVVRRSGGHTWETETGRWTATGEMAWSGWKPWEMVT